MIFTLQAKTLYVSVDGDDSTSYEANSLSYPWATPKRAWLYAQTGDTVRFRGGTYNVVETINTKYVASNGTAEAPIVFTNYNNEDVVITGDVGGGPIFVIEKSYNYIHNLTLRGGNFSGGGMEGSVLFIGWDLAADHFKITNSTIEVYQSNTYSNNASIRINSNLSNFAEIRDCKIIGDGGTIGVQIFRTQGVKILNNEFSNCGLGVYMKHSNALDSSLHLVNVVESNVFRDMSREAVYGNFNYGIIKNNLLIDCGISFGDDGGVGDGYVGADYNLISHNTLYNSGIEFVYESRENDPNKGCLHNRIIDNIIMTQCIWHDYDNIDADIQSDYNLYPPIKNLISEFGIVYDINQWQIKNGTDHNSIAANPIFKGGNIFGSYTDYSLIDSSPGKQAASDGADMGADLHTVGINKGVTAIDYIKKIKNKNLSNKYFSLEIRNNLPVVNVRLKGKYLIKVFNIQGRIVASSSQTFYDTGIFDIVDSELAKGTYIINVHTDNKRFSIRFIRF